MRETVQREMAGATVTQSDNVVHSADPQWNVTVQGKPAMCETAANGEIGVGDNAPPQKTQDRSDFAQGVPNLTHGRSLAALGRSATRLRPSSTADIPHPEDTVPKKQFHGVGTAARLWKYQVMRGRPVLSHAEAGSA